jgi:hypothetical protein
MLLDSEQRQFPGYGGEHMRVRSGSIVATMVLCLAWLMGGAAAQAQTIHASVEDIALRNGESVEFGDVYLVGANCSSLLTRAPEVEVMDGPPGVAVAIKEAMVIPSAHGCEQSVLGGKMLITAKNVDAYSYTRMVLRITYQTPGGSLQRSQHINVTLFP